MEYANVLEGRIVKLEPLAESHFEELCEPPSGRPDGFRFSLPLRFLPKIARVCLCHLDERA